MWNLYWKVESGLSGFQTLTYIFTFSLELIYLRFSWVDEDGQLIGDGSLYSHCMRRRLDIKK